MRGEMQKPIGWCERLEDMASRNAGSEMSTHSLDLLRAMIAHVKSIGQLLSDQVQISLDTSDLQPPRLYYEECYEKTFVVAQALAQRVRALLEHQAVQLSDQAQQIIESSTELIHPRHRRPS